MLYNIICITLVVWLSIGYLHADNYPNDRSFLDSTIQPFYHGVASGDPLADRVIIWTHVTTDLPSVDVKWRVVTDTNMQNIISQGTITTGNSRDYTVKLDITNLQLNTYYY